MKFISVIEAKYDPKTNAVSALFKTADGRIENIEIDGTAFANLMGLANISNSIAHHLQTGKEMPWLQVTGLQTGSMSNKEGQHSFGLTLLVRQIGQLNFVLPPAIEMALREKLQIPQSPVKH